MAARSSIAESPGGELAPVIPLDPSQSEEGFFEGYGLDLDYQKLLSLDPLSVVGGVWRGISGVKDQLLGNVAPHTDPVPKKVFLPYNGHDHLFLVTEPSAEAGVDPDEADNVVLKPGLGELADSGSALRLHIEFARHNPDRRIITEATKGMSHTGKTSGEFSERRIEKMAADSLKLLPRLTRDGWIEIDGTSLGTRSAFSMAEQNMAANPGERLDITRLTLIASAVIASKVEGSENFRDPELDEDEYRNDLSKRFQLHVAEDFLRMARNHPMDILSCWPAVGAYVVSPPARTLNRLKAIFKDYANVKEGVPWESMKQVVPGVGIRLLGGSRDPLVQEQAPQWQALDEMFPGQIRQRTVEGMGHLMTADARGTVAHLAEMDEAETAELAVAA